MCYVPHMMITARDHTETPARSQDREPARRARRIGPIGRLARLGLAAAVAVTLGSLIDARGPARFRDPHVLTEPSAWFVHALMLVLFVLLVKAIVEPLAGPRAARRAQVLALSGLGVAVAMAALVDLRTGGAVWDLALGGLVWTFDILMLAQELAALLLAVALGTPGCEIGVWAELMGTDGRAEGTDAIACIVGLHLLDRWEMARRRAGS